ncbi:MAG TPA: helix-turn-helix transcriptional regulator [Planctomycetota bacterium]|nr:helix-turn-helix transcriptional regulator [Planctomycetota bacterium]
MSHDSRFSSVPFAIDIQHVHEEVAFKVSTPIAHEHDALILLLRGQGSFASATVSRELRGPTACFVRARETMENALVGEVEYWLIDLDGAGCRPSGDDEAHLEFSFGNQTQIMPRVLELDALTACQLVELCRLLAGSMQSAGVASALKARGALLNLLALYFSQGPNEGSKTLHRGMARLRELLVKHACDETSLADLAHSAGVAPTHAGELFRKEFGIRPVEFRTQIRLEKARDMLATTTLNIKEVARKCGYPDPLYFSKLFRRHFGLSPGEIIHRYRTSAPAERKDH